jgi:hypothetical protein
MKQLSKFAVLGALLATVMATSAARAYDGAHDQWTPAYTGSQWNEPQNEVNKIDVGEGGGGA